MSATQDHFPLTPRTRFFESLDLGRRRELAQELMVRYAEPLQRYYAATSFNWLGAPRDQVAGFFASRLAKPDWISEWRTRHQVDGMPLRRWLMNALNFYLQEEARRRGREGRAIDGPSLIAARGGSRGEASPPEREFEREAARALVADALEATRHRCAEAGQLQHFEVFVRHLLHDIPYGDMAGEFALTPSHCAGMSRTVSVKFRRAVAELLMEEGIDPQDVEAEIARLMEVLRP